ADVEADVAETVEEEKVAGTEPGARDAVAHLELPARIVRQHDPEVGVDEPGEARAVEAAPGGRAAIGVWDAEEVAGEPNHCRLLVGNDGGARDDGQVMAVDGAKCSADARGDTAGDDEDEQRKANAIGHREAP